MTTLTLTAEDLHEALCLVTEKRTRLAATATSRHTKLSSTSAIEASVNRLAKLERRLQEAVDAMT